MSDPDNGFLIREAKTEDIDFLIDTVIAAEKGNTDVISYCRIFEISEQVFREMLKEILFQDLPDFEFGLSTFLVAEKEGLPAAACSAWIESAGEIPSKILKASTLLYYLKPESVAAARNKHEAIKGTIIEREPGSVQIDSVYVTEASRGRGLISKLIRSQFQRLNPGNLPGKAQVLCRKNNPAAIRAYQKAGFVIKTEKESRHPDTLKYLPSTINILMEINNIQIE